MNEITVRTEKPYSVYIGGDLLTQTGSLVKKTMLQRHNNIPQIAVIVTDDIVAPLYEPTVKEALVQEGFTVITYIFPHGEQSKSMTELEKLLIFLAENNVLKTDVLLALGGGVVGDLAGFAASVYLRGTPYIQIPTTVLAAVDSSVGGKTAVNLPQGKNLAGAFYQPEMVLCSTNTFQTLPEDVYTAGLAECIKYGMIEDENLFARFAKSREEVCKQIETIVASCVATKARITQQDEFDDNTRRLLNFGHTAGHGIEVCSNFTVSHGQAVGMGMVIAARIAEKLNFCESPCSKQLKEVLETQGLLAETNVSAAELAKLALQDKKRRANEITIVLPRRIGKCELYTVQTSELQTLFEMGLAE